jgi:hypothetical protein
VSFDRESGMRLRRDAFRWQRIGDLRHDVVHDDTDERRPGDPDAERIPG